MNGDTSHSDSEGNAPGQAKAEKSALPGGVRPLDIAIIALVVALTVLAGIRIYGNRGDTARLVIEAPTGRWIYALDRESGTHAFRTRC